MSRCRKCGKKQGVEVKEDGVPADPSEYHKPRTLRIFINGVYVDQVVGTLSAPRLEEVLNMAYAHGAQRAEDNGL